MKKQLLLLISSAFALASCGGNPSNPGKSEDPTAPVKDGTIALKKNADGENVEIIHPGLKAYVDAMYAADADTDDEDIIYGVREVDSKKSEYLCKGVDAATFRTYQGTKNLDGAQPVALEWEGEGEFKVKYATNKMLTNAKELTVTGGSAELINLYADTTYYWQVQTADGAHDSKLGSFHTNGHFRTIESGDAYNVRDIGGKPTKDGKRIKQGYVYRGCELVTTEINKTLNHGVTLTENNLSLFQDELKIKHEFDLRKPGTSTVGSQVGFSSLADEDHDVKYTQYALGSFGDLWKQGNPTELKASFKIFAEAKEDAAVYCHCWGGADRTGTLIFILEGLLGVSFLEAAMDYEITSFDNGAHERYRDRIVQNTYDFPGFIKAVKESDYYDEGKSLQATIETWMEDRVGMSKEEIQELKDNLLEDNPNVAE
ncbi:MAG: tyrosine-protein phosphatase [Bacilli bacterium]|nr:tyrosine-protein phosphatase [Bacilli bacterium]